MMKLGIFFLIIVMNIVAHPVCAQDVAVKTNILSDVFLNETKCFFKMRKYSANLLKFK